MTTANPSVSEVFSKRAEYWEASAPLFAAVCRVIADEPGLAAAEVAVLAPDASRWPLAHRWCATATRLLRTTARDHPLARYWPTLGGDRGPDAALPDAVRDLVDRYSPRLAAIIDGRPDSRSNDPAEAAALWPGIAWAASRISGPVALLELGSAAGLCLYPDKFGYRYGDTLIRGDSPLVLDCDFTGQAPGLLAVEPDVTARIGLDLDPIRREDTTAIAWLRDGVLPDHTDRLADMDNALSLMPIGGVDWRAGDFLDTLPGALAQVPVEVTPVVYGSHMLCCVERPESLPKILGDSGRDLVWIADECSDDALGLVSDAADDYLTQPPTTLLTAVTYRAGHATEAHVLGKTQPVRRALAWDPLRVELR